MRLQATFVSIEPTNFAHYSAQCCTFISFLVLYVSLIDKLQNVKIRKGCTGEKGDKGDYGQTLNIHIKLSFIHFCPSTTILRWMTRVRLFDLFIKIILHRQVPYRFIDINAEYFHSV